MIPSAGRLASAVLAAAIARGEMLALLNNDLVLTPGWLEPILSAHASLGPTRAGLIGNVQLDAKTGALDHAGTSVAAVRLFELLPRHPVVSVAFAIKQLGSASPPRDGPSRPWRMPEFSSRPPATNT